MADLFVSYSSRDRAFIVPLVEYLERIGYTVWWDRHIDAGSTFDKDIEDALDAAKCVIVVWSRNSVRSDWVRAEANEGLTRGILVPVIIDETRPPLIFRSLQNLDYRLGNESDLAQLATAIRKAAPSVRPSIADSAIPESTNDTYTEPASTTAVGSRDWSIPPFVGREVLLSSLEDALALAGRGSGQAIMLSGEPGIGKSRTAQEFGDRARQKGAVVYAGWCDESMYTPPYWPLTRLLRNILEELDPPLQRAEVGHGGAVLSGILPELRDMFPDIGQVPEYSPEHLNFETAQALFNLLHRLSDRRPVVILFDDLHCADEQTLTVLLMLAREIARSSIVFLGNFRDTELDNDHRLSQGLLELSRVGHFRRHELEGLTREEVTRFMRESVDGSEQLAEAVIEKTDGNPLFVTEIGRSINIEGTGAAIRQAGDLAVPRSLQDLVLNRLRDLSADCRQFLDIASVMGRTLKPEMICDVGQIDFQAGKSAITEASQAGVVDIGPSGRLRFAHILLRDAMYEELNPGIRVEWHRTIAENFESQADSSVGTASHCETIAHHFQQAGMVDRALDYWEKAAAIARGQSAHADAILRLKQALDLLTDSGLDSRARVEREIRLRLSLGGNLIALEGAGSMDAVPEFRRALELCNLYPDSPSLFFAVNGVWSYHAMHCNSEAIPLVERQRELSAQLNSQAVQVLATNAEGTTRFFEGDFELALDRLEQASGSWSELLKRRISEGKGGSVLSACLGSPSYHAWCLALLGCADEGLALAERTLGQALDLGTQAHVHALSYVAVIHETTGNYTRLRDVSRQIIQIAEENGYVSWLAVAHCTHGMAIAQLGDTQAGLEEAQAGREAYRELGGFLCLTWRQLQLAEILRMNGQLQDAIAMVDQTLAASTDRFEHFVDPELYRMRGECALELGETDGLDWLRRAQKMSNSRGARLFELRAAASLLEHTEEPGVIQRLNVLETEIGKGIGAADRQRVSRALAGS